MSRLSALDFAHRSTLLTNNPTPPIRGEALIRKEVDVRFVSAARDEATGEQFEPTGEAVTLPDVQAIRFVEEGFAEYVPEKEDDSAPDKDLRKEQTEEQKEAQKAAKEQHKALGKAKTREA